MATPAFTRAQQQTQSIRQVYLHSTVMVATAQWSFFALLAVFAHETVWVLFGPNWLECVPVLQILAVGAMVWAPVTLGSSALTSRQAVRCQLQIQLVYAPLAVLGLLLGALHSLEAMAVLFSLARLVRALHTSHAVHQVFGIGLKEVLQRLLPTAAVAAAGGIVGAMVKALLVADGQPTWVVLPGGAVAALLAAAAVAWRLNHPLVIEVKRLARRRIELADSANKVSVFNG